MVSEVEDHRLQSINENMSVCSNSCFHVLKGTWTLHVSSSQAITRQVAVLMLINLTALLFWLVAYL